MGDHARLFRWFGYRALWSEARQLHDELESVRTLLRRIGAVKKLGSVGYAATQGVRSKETKQQI